jgi:hypothetical protein
MENSPEGTDCKKRYERLGLPHIIFIGHLEQFVENFEN